MNTRYIYYALLLLSIVFSSVTCSEKISDSDQNNNRPTSFNSDDDFLDFIQKSHIDYMWSGAESNSGLAPERIHMDGDYPQNDADVVTTGGSGFGIAGLIVGIERGFIPRDEGVARLHKIVDFLKDSDRYHGMWSHWIYGKTGKTKEFGQKDDGADIVESSFLMQGLLIARQYFKDGKDAEKELSNKIDVLWREMNWQWHLREGDDALYWHWSPNYGWDMNFAIRGFDECLITYILAASSPTYPIPASAYYNGWTLNGGIKSDRIAYGLPLVVKHNGSENYGGPLFWSQYSFIGLNPNGLIDKYVDYGEATKNHALIDYRYCVENPLGYKGYSDSCWGLTASYTIDGYTAHKPMTNDKGVITPTAALSSFPYTPTESMKALKFFYNDLGDKIWGKYGFYDAFSIQSDWYPKRYLAIDQLTIAPMIENQRTGLLWELFMSAPEIQEGLNKLDFKFTLPN